MVHLRSVKTKLTLTVAAVVLFFTTLLVLLSYGLLRDMAREYSSELAGTITDETDKHITRFFRDMEELARSFREYPPVYEADVPRLRQLILATVGSRRSYMRAIYLGTETGQMYEWGYGEGFIENEPSFPPGYDPRERPWYRRAIEADDFAVTAPYLYASIDAIGITCVIPVDHPDGQRVGVLGFDIMLDDLKALVEEMEIGLNGKALLLDQEGTPLVNQFSGAGGQELPRFALAGEGASDSASAAGSTHRRFTAEVNSAPYLISFTRNRLTGWTLYIGLPLQEIMASTYANIRTAIALDLLLMVLLLLALEWSGRRMLIEPVEHMVDTISRIRRGEGEARISVRREDEFAILARSFNRLADRVEEYTNEMEHKVRERTERLRALQQENIRLRIIEEKERIYGYLHDSLGARLTNINISNNVARSAAHQAGLSAAAPLLADMHDRIEENARAGLEDLKEILTGSREEGRAVLDFRTLLEMQVRRRLDLKGIAFTFHGDVEELNLLDRDLAYEVEKLLQELVSNVLKHAEASTVRLYTEFRGEELYLLFTDDGRGFDQQQVATDSFGLSGLRGRIARLGGTITFRSRPGEGTVVEVQMPTSREESDEHD